MEKGKKLISIVVPVYNEQDCLQTLYERTTAVMEHLSEYTYEIVFFDDGSTDDSKHIITDLCAAHKHCKAVFLARNYGYNLAIFHAMQQAKGNCAVLLHADLQNPPELIPEMIEKWENGADAVFGVKNKSKENKGMYFIRTLFYRIMNLVFGMHLIPHATDFELVDKSVIAGLRHCAYKEPFLRMLLLDLARNQEIVYYTQEKRYAGETHFSFKTYYELAVSWIVASSKVLPRRFLCLGLVLFCAELIELFAGFLPHINSFTYENIFTALLVRIILILLSVFICFGAIMGEFIIKNSEHSSVQNEITEEKRIDY